ncbi:hypothetical protein HMPREF3192_00790 [Atopobium deltae]|uniref:Uncharacterized protein n=1 Tax=Atopobium deltae TaxID=1393034 RepID=A0A133XUS6_9ACTN|nr:hypothetical protein HMPREF3192_00790 [Atopobium deltae]
MRSAINSELAVRMAEPIAPIMSERVVRAEDPAPGVRGVPDARSASDVLDAADG